MFNNFDLLKLWSILNTSFSILLIKYKLTVSRNYNKKIQPSIFEQQFYTVKNQRKIHPKELELI